MKFIFLLVIMSFMGSLAAEAALNLTVTPYEGGTTLRFGRVNSSSLINKEVKIRITSTDGKQYRVRQRLLEPVVNDQGIILKEGVLNFYTSRGSNAFGTLYQDNLRPLSTRDDILYTSNTAGNSDSFIAIYSLDGSKLVDSGYFRGKILYTLEPQGGGSPETIILNIDFNAEVKFDISLRSSSGSDKLKLDTKSEDTMRDYLEFSINTNLARPVTLYQKVGTLPRNDRGKVLDERAIKFSASGAKSGQIYYHSPSYLGHRDIIIYSSTNGSIDSFRIDFLIDEDSLGDIEAGTYRGMLVYYLEGESISETIPIDLEIEVREIFDMEIIAEGPLSFADLKPDSLPQDKKVTVVINSNLKKPYQVIQRIDTPLTDKEGNTIPEEFFTMRQDLLEDEEGEIAYSSFVPVEKGDKVIFKSDATGSSSSFEVIYQLTPSFDIRAGDYFVHVMYSLSEK